MPVVRRNGAAPSCEPCRKAKIRCNHETPCRRCTRRGMQDACYYHPSPMTRSAGALSQIGPVPPAEPSPPARHALQPRPPAHTQQYRTVKPAQEEPRSPAADASPSNRHIIDIAAAITQLHDNYALADRIIRAHCSKSIKSLVPAQFSISILESLSRLFQKHRIDDSGKKKAGARTAATQVLESTSAGWASDPAVTPEDFISSWCGDNFRAQTIGLICNHAAIAALLDSTHDDKRHEEFVQTMLACSTACLSIARDVAPRADDILLWLGHENLYLLMAVKGDRDPSVWPRLGLLGSDLYALGLHREATLQANVPLFLVELRRKVFASVYHLDNLICVYFNSPPRVLRKYADTRPPLDLQDHQLLGNNVELAAAISCLTEEGWSTNENYTSTTWARMRYFLGIVKEQIVQFSYRPQPLSPEDTSEIRALSTRNHEIWASFPLRLRYTRECWQSSSPAICDMLAIAYLQYLHTDLQIYHLLEKLDASSDLALLSSAAEMLATTVQLGNIRDRAIPLAFVGWNWGMPSAAVLTSTLANCRRLGQPFPEGLSKATIVRHLSVFVSYLENMFQPDNANYKIAKQASSTIVRTLDDIFADGEERSTSKRTTATPRHDLTSAEFPLLASSSDVHSAFLGSAGAASWPANDQDFTEWMTNIDWAAATNNEWGYM